MLSLQVLVYQRRDFMVKYAIARGLDPTLFEPHPANENNESCAARVAVPEEEVPERYRHVADVKEYYTKRACAGESFGGGGVRVSRFGRDLEAMGFGAWPELSALLAPFYHLPDDLPPPVHISQPSSEHSLPQGKESACADADAAPAGGSASIVAEATVIKTSSSTHDLHSSQNNQKLQI